MDGTPFKVLYPWCGQQLGCAVLTPDCCLWTAVNIPFCNARDEPSRSTTLLAMPMMSLSDLIGTQESAPPLLLHATVLRRWIGNPWSWEGPSLPGSFFSSCVVFPSRNASLPFAALLTAVWTQCWLYTAKKNFNSCRPGLCNREHLDFQPGGTLTIRDPPAQEMLVRLLQRAASD